MKKTETKIINLRRLEKVLSCSRCKPNKGENRKKRCKHFSKSWKLKRKTQHYKSLLTTLE